MTVLPLHAKDIVSILALLSIVIVGPIIWPTISNSLREIFTESILDAATLEVHVQTKSIHLSTCLHSPSANFCNFTKSEEDKVLWNPKPHKYLLAFCAAGQLSNHMYCFRNYVLLAAILQRTLILPQTSVDGRKYNYSAVFDLSHAKKLLGNRRVIGRNDYFKLEPKLKFIKVTVSCWTPTICLCDGKSVKLLKGSAIIANSCPKSTLSLKATRTEFLKMYQNDNSSVLSLGDVFFVKFKNRSNLYQQLHAIIEPLGVHQAVILPARGLINAAYEFVEHFVRSKYLTVHLRRGDFFSHCLLRKYAFCYPSVAHIGACLAGTMENLKSTHNVTKILVASNGESDEKLFLKNTLASLMYGEYVEVVYIEEIVGFYEFLKSRRIDDTASQITFLKLVMSMGEVFCAYYMSSFSQDVMWIRHGLNKTSDLDGFCPKFNDQSPRFHTAT